MLPIAAELLQCQYLIVKVNQTLQQEAGIRGSGTSIVASVNMLLHCWSGRLSTTDSGGQPGSNDRYLQEADTLGKIPGSGSKPLHLDQLVPYSSMPLLPVAAVAKMFMICTYICCEVAASPKGVTD